MKIILVFAHPDDETFGCGGTTAKLAKAGNEVKLITVTLGEQGQLGDPPLTTQEKLPQVRKKELECAAKILGIKQIFYLGFKDGELNKIDLNDLTKQISDILSKEKADIVITFDKHGGSNHPDHIATSRAATLAFHKYQSNVIKQVKLYHTAIPRSYIKKFAGTDVEYKAFGKIEGVSDEKITTTVNIKDTLDIKAQAMRCHMTQKKDWERILKRAKYVDTSKEFFQLISENSLS